MNTLNQSGFARISDLITRLDQFSEAGVDPSFDGECEELERQFSELRFTSAHN